MFTILLKDEKATIGTKVTGDVATVQHATVHPVLAPRSTGTRIQLEWAFDFTDVSRAELCEIASRSLVITMRAPFKTLEKPEPQDWNNKTFDVREWLDTEKRRPADKVGNAKKAFASLSAAERAALLASLTSDDETE